MVQQNIANRSVSRHLTEEHKQKIRASNVGKLRNASTKARISAGKMGHPVSMETRRKISQAVIDFMVKNPERQGNMVLARQGRTSKPQLNMYQIIKMKVGEVEVILNHHVRTLNHYRFIDVAIPSLMLGFEYDGEYFHSDVSHDKQRDAELVAIGWTIAHIDSNGLKYMAGKQKHRGRKKSKAHR